MVAQMLEKDKAERTRRLTKKGQEFQKQKQQLKDKHEFDIWDPNQLRKCPAHFSDGPSYGLSSLQRFAGEDLNRATFLRMQQEQVRYSLEKQMQEQQQARIDKECTGKQLGPGLIRGVQVSSWALQAGSCPEVGTAPRM